MASTLHLATNASLTLIAMMYYVKKSKLINICLFLYYRIIFITGYAPESHLPSIGQEQGRDVRHDVLDNAVFTIE